MQAQLEGANRGLRAAQAKCASLEQALKAEQSNPDGVAAIRQVLPPLPHTSDHCMPLWRVGNRV